MSSGVEKEEEKPVVAKTAVDLQRLKLMKLMKHPEKPVILPERPKAKNTPTVPEFVRNVMGSSAGAGSGEFHVYRHLRRKEYARQKFIQEKGRKELLDDEYHLKLEQNRKLADEVTAKKRAKRLKKKQRQKGKKKVKNAGKPDVKSDGNNTEDTASESDEAEPESCNTTENEQTQRCESVTEDTAEDRGKMIDQNINEESSEQNSSADKSEETTDNLKQDCDEGNPRTEPEKQLGEGSGSEEKSNNEKYEENT